MRLPLAALVLTAGCYAELWGGGYPVSRSTSTPAGQAEVTDDSPSYSIGVSVGLWLEHYGFGLGYGSRSVSPEAVVSRVGGERHQSTVRADQVRLDVDLPVRWWNPWFYPRATVAYGGVGTVDRCLSTDAACAQRTDQPATGRSLFLGLTATFFSRSFAVSAGPSYVGFAHAGVGDLPAVDYAAWGAQVRILVRFAFGLEAMQYYTPSVIRPLPANPTVRCKAFSHDRDCWP